MRRILFVSEALNAAPTRYRALPYFDRLRQRGWEPRHITVVGLWRRLALLHAARSADVIVVMRKMFTPMLCRRLQAGGTKLILDIDDALFARDDGTQPDKTARDFARMTTCVDAVWAGNTYLAEYAQQFCKSTAVMPTSVDPARYLIAPPPPTPHFDVVWIGSSSTRKYLEALLPALGEATRLVPRLRLKIIADFDLPQAAAYGVTILAVPWNENAEAEQLSTAHVGVAPLPDDPWTRGKCGLKILQYMAAGLPVVASPVGVQKHMIRENETGWLVATAGQWAEALRKLDAQPALRAQMGAAARRQVAAEYSLAVTFEKLFQSLTQLANT